MGINNYLRNPEFDIDFAGRLDHTELPYPMKPLQVGEDECMVYEIPEEDMPKVLNMVNPYERRNAEDLMFDELKGECFKWKQAIVIRHRNTNLLVSPFFAECGANLHWIREWHPGIQKSRIPLICNGHKDQNKTTSNKS